VACVGFLARQCLLGFSFGRNYLDGVVCSDNFCNSNGFFEFFFVSVLLGCAMIMGV
jgi:hypothetical protein